MAQGIKDLALLLLWHGFNLWPGNFHMPWVWPKKKKKERKKKLNVSDINSEKNVWPIHQAFDF